MDDLLSGRTLIARAGEAIRDVWVAETPVEDKYKPADEVIEFRDRAGNTIAAREAK